MNMETSKLTAEGIIGEAVRIGAKMSGGEFPIEVFPIRIQRIDKPCAVFPRPASSLLNPALNEVVKIGRAHV